MTEEKTEKTFWVKIFLAGDAAVIEQACRKYTFHFPLCVTVTRTKFIYTGGEEAGVEIGLINYPRFPATEDDILKKAKLLALHLRKAAFQRSVLIMTPSETRWISG